MSELHEKAQEALTRYAKFGAQAAATIMADTIAALLAENERLNGELENQACYIEKLHGYETRLKTLCEAERDAARYRAIRDHRDEEGDVDDSFHVHVESPRWPNRWALTGEELDAELDAMLAAAPEAKS